LKVNRDKVNAQASKVNELNQFNVKRTLKDQIDSVTLRANPGNVDMQVKQRIKDLERSNKTKLSDAQKKTVEALVKL